MFCRTLIIRLVIVNLPVFQASAEEELKAAKATEEELKAALNQQKTLLNTEEERSKSEEVNSLVTQLALAEG